MDMNERIIELESRLAYQERTIEELNQVVTGQQQQIDDLLREIERIKAYLKQGGDSGIARADEETPPPHY